MFYDFERIVFTEEIEKILIRSRVLRLFHLDHSFKETCSLKYVCLAICVVEIYGELGIHINLQRGQKKINVDFYRKFYMLSF